MAASIDDVINRIGAEKTVVDSAVQLLAQLKTLLQGAINSGDPTKIQAALDMIDANSKELADAVVANTPAAPPPPPAPAPAP